MGDDTSTEIERALRHAATAHGGATGSLLIEAADTIRRLGSNYCARVPVEFFGSPRKVRARIGDWRLTAVTDSMSGGVAVYEYQPPSASAKAARRFRGSHKENTDV